MIVRLIDIPAGTPGGILDSNAHLTLDLPVGFNLKATKIRSQQTETNDIKDEASLAFDLPKTVKNNWILRNYRSPNVVDKDYALIPVLAYEGSYYNNFDRLFVQGLSDPGRNYTAQLVKSTDFWLKKAASFSLNKLDFGTFIFSTTNIIDSQNDMEYNDGDSGYTFPQVDYGFRTRYWAESSTPGEYDVAEAAYAPEYLRPLFSPLAILQKGFCALGWRFESPILETSRFRKVWAYLLGPNFGNYEGKGSGFWGFRATKFFSSPPWNVSTSGNFDNLGHIIATADPIFSYQNLRKFTIHIGANATGILPSDVIDNIYDFELYIRSANDEGEQEERLAESLSIEVLALNTYNFNIDFGPIYLHPDEVFSIHLYRRASSAAPDSRIAITFPQGTVVTSNFDDTNLIYRDDVIAPAKMINADYNLLQFMKGVAELGDFIWHTDYTKRTVYLYPRQNTLFFGTEIEGFLKPDTEHKDMRGKCIADTLKAIYPSFEDKRYKLFQFAEAGDAYIKSLDLPTIEPPFGHLADLQRGISDIEYVENSFFEPTLEKSWNKITLPVMWDNDNTEVSTDIGPRLLYAVGRVSQVSTLRNDPRVIGVHVYDNAETTFVAYASHSPTARFIGAGGLANPETPDWGIVYGYNDNDLWKFIKPWQLINRYSERHSYLMFFNTLDYRFEDFRQKWLMRYNGRDFIAEPTEIQNHEFSTEVTECIVYPSPQLGTIPECFETTVYQEIIIGHFESHQDIIFYNATQALDFTLDSFRINGIEQITGTVPSLNIPTGGASVSLINGFNVVTNIVDWLNSIGLPNFTFTDIGNVDGKCGPGIKVRFPTGFNFQFTANQSAAWADTIVGNSEAGMQYIETNPGFPIALTDARACDDDYFNERFPGVIVIENPILE